MKLLKIHLSSSKEVNFYCTFSIVVNLIGQMLFRLSVLLFRNSFCRFWWGPGLVNEEVIKGRIFFILLHLNFCRCCKFYDFQHFQHIFALVWWNKISCVCRGEGWQAECSQLNISCLAENLIHSCGSIPVRKGLGHSHGVFWSHLQVTVTHPRVKQPTWKCFRNPVQSDTGGLHTQNCNSSSSLGMKAGMLSCHPGLSPLTKVSSSPHPTEESLWFLGGFPEHCGGWQSVEGEGQQVPVSSTGMAVGMTDTQPKKFITEEFVLKISIDLGFSLRIMSML